MVNPAYISLAKIVGTNVYNYGKSRGKQWLRDNSGRLIRGAAANVSKGWYSTNANFANAAPYGNAANQAASRKNKYRAGVTPPPKKLMKGNYLRSLINDQFDRGFGKAKRITRKHKRFDRKPSLVKATAQLVTTTTTTEPNCVNLVFTNLLKSQARNDVSRAITRHLFWKQGISVGLWSNIPDTVLAANTFQFNLNFRTSAGLVSTNTASSHPAGSTSFDVFALDIDFLINSVSTSDTVLDIVLRQYSGTNQVECSRLYCDTGYVIIDQLHIVRIQNHSGTVEPDLRDSVALVGKQILGHGHYPMLADTNQAPTINFSVSDSDILQVVAAGSIQMLKQPLNVTLLANSTHSNTFQFENGKIKTFSMKFHHSYKLSELGSWWENDMNPGAIPIISNSSRWHRWKMFSMEKAIGNSGNINFQVESDSFTSGLVSGGNSPAVAAPNVSA